MDISFLIIRHRKENIRKCSLRTLHDRPDMLFFQYPGCADQGVLPSLEDFTLLDVEGDLLTERDAGPFVILDATWRYAAVMLGQLPQVQKCRRRRLPDGWRTSYPRRQTDCPDPERGLASIEAMYVATAVVGRPDETLLNGYYWKEVFFEINKDQLEASGVL